MDGGVNMHETYNAYVTRVIDGDTFVADVPFHVLGNVMILRDQYFRLEGINTPEIKGNEKDLGLEVKTYVESLILHKEVRVTVNKKEKYGRWLAAVTIGNLELNDHLVLKGYAERRDY